MNHFEKFDKANRNFFAENTRFFEYYVRIQVLKIGDDMGRYVCTLILKLMKA